MSIPAEFFSAPAHPLQRRYEMCPRSRPRSMPKACPTPPSASSTACSRPRASRACRAARGPGAPPPLPNWPRPATSPWRPASARIFRPSAPPACSACCLGSVPTASTKPSTRPATPAPPRWPGCEPTAACSATPPTWISPPCPLGRRRHPAEALGRQPRARPARPLGRLGAEPRQRPAAARRRRRAGVPRLLPPARRGAALPGLRRALRDLRQPCQAGSRGCPLRHAAPPRQKARLPIPMIVNADSSKAVQTNPVHGVESQRAVIRRRGHPLDGVQVEVLSSKPGADGSLALRVRMPDGKLRSLPASWTDRAGPPASARGRLADYHALWRLAGSLERAHGGQAADGGQGSSAAGAAGLGGAAGALGERPAGGARGPGRRAGAADGAGRGERGRSA